MTYNIELPLPNRYHFTRFLHLVGQWSRELLLSAILLSNNISTNVQLDTNTNAVWNGVKMTHMAEPSTHSSKNKVTTSKGMQKMQTRRSQNTTLNSKTKLIFFRLSARNSIASVTLLPRPPTTAMKMYKAANMFTEVVDMLIVCWNMIKNEMLVEYINTTGKITFENYISHG